MRLLYGEQKEKTEVFTYTVNQGGELHIKVSNGSERQVQIVFKNEKVSHVDHDIDEAFSIERSYWHVMRAIADKIEELEGNYKVPKQK